ncbi:MAG: hypothetical protein KKF33_20395 [Alphaproteobacteria bacterium]|nr:hypothetical protein [Alphaproteobacteria bacterium]
MELKNIENVGEITQEHKARFVEIFEALIVSGGLTGVKRGKTIIHFDLDGVFQGIQIDYWPWKRRKLDKDV